MITVVRPAVAFKKPIPIEVGEWWYKGCFIQEQSHPSLAKYLVFKDNIGQDHVDTATTMADAKKLCKANEVKDYCMGPEAFI